MKCVYILRSVSDAEHFYASLTDNVDARLKRHNAGGVPRTSKYARWALKTYIAFADDAQAVAFERYLKTASGRAFAMKRL
ncbi:MAG: excinuclease ABC subunit C [Alphaproteobacteria bacterium]|nr:MAG: excinuclease ABC subunit C [Caulobacteraceae bacterium]TPW02449.1 MAG: excinuclease ABC subunit C [Alphaproteobacteria bacterium]